MYGMSTLLKFLFANGAGAVKAVAVGKDESEEKDYASAFAALSDEEDAQKLMDAPSWADRMAAGGMTTSLGTGKMELSMAIRTMTPAYPQSCTQDIQSEINSCITARILH